MGLELLKDVVPQFGNRQALVVEFASEDELALAIDLQAVLVPRNHTIQTGRLLEAPREGQQPGEDYQVLHCTCLESRDVPYYGIYKY
jgi:hypothetical protein